MASKRELSRPANWMLCRPGARDLKRQQGLASLTPRRQPVASGRVPPGWLPAAVEDREPRAGRVHALGGGGRVPGRHD